jgi:hypothetical protein
MQDLTPSWAHDYLGERGYRLDCGVGRHLLAVRSTTGATPSATDQHYTDGDVVNQDHRPSRPAGTAEETAGAKPPLEFFIATFAAA